MQLQNYSVLVSVISPFLRWSSYIYKCTPWNSFF